MGISIIDHRSSIIDPLDDPLPPTYNASTIDGIRGDLPLLAATLNKC